MHLAMAEVIGFRAFRTVEHTALAICASRHNDHYSIVQQIRSRGDSYIGTKSYRD